jgi:peptide/nickel transport system substrate-binding protein
MTKMLTMVLAALLLSACGDPVPRTGIVLGMQLEPPGLDPTRGAAAAIDGVVYGNVFEGLTRIIEDGSVQPALAQSWDISADGRDYVFHLQSGVRFHDGSIFDAQDVKFSLERIIAPGSANAQKALFAPIKSVSILDPQTVRVSLHHPAGDFLYTLGLGDAVMVAEQTAAQNAVHPVGTGPFMFAEWRKGYAITLVRNPEYWGKAAKSQGVKFIFISDPAAAYAALLAGDVDGFSNYPAPENLPAFERDPRFSVVIGATEGETILAINNGRVPFNDVRVRRAIAYALNRKDIIDGAMFGRGLPIGSHFSPGHEAYVDLTGMYPHDPAKAKKLLKEAGYADGFSATLKLPPPSYARRSGEIIASELAKVGIRITIQNVEWASWLDQVFTNKEYDLTIVSHSEPMDIGIYARPDYYFQYQSKAFNAIMEALALSNDPQQRDALLQAAQRQIATDSVNGFLFQFPKLGVWDLRLKGMWKNAPIQGENLSGVYFEQ